MSPWCRTRASAKPRARSGRLGGVDLAQLRRGDLLEVRDARRQAGRRRLVGVRQAQRAGDLAHGGLVQPGVGERPQHPMVRRGPRAGTVGTQRRRRRSRRRRSRVSWCRSATSSRDPGEQLVLAVEAAVRPVGPVLGACRPRASRARPAGRRSSPPPRARPSRSSAARLGETPRIASVRVGPRARAASASRTDESTPPEKATPSRSGLPRACGDPVGQRSPGPPVSGSDQCGRSCTSASRGAGRPRPRGESRPSRDLDLGAVGRPQGVEGARPGRPAGRCGRRRSRAGPGSGRRAAARRAGRRSRPARRRTPGVGMPASAAWATTRRQAASAGADRLGEVRVGDQQRQVGVALVGLGDPVEELGADDAAAAPDAGHRAAVDVPAVLRRWPRRSGRSPASRRRPSRRTAPGGRPR